MNIFDLIELDPQKIVDILAGIGISLTISEVECYTNILIYFFAFGGIILWCYKKFTTVEEFFCKKYAWRKRYIHNGLEHSFGDYLQKEKRELYIPTKFQNNPPYDYDEPDEAIGGSAKQDLLDFFLKDVLVEQNTNRWLYCILAGSGMGKTTFLVQLFCHYINKYKESTIPFNIYMLDLADTNVINRINELTADKNVVAHDSILLLDGLDENMHASEDFETFRHNLEKAIEPYKYVILSCRSQFFADDTSIPLNSSIHTCTGNKNLLRYNRLFICPFTPDDINNYIIKKYKNRKLRKKAKNIILQCHHLMARPVLLSHIDDLLEENRDYQNEADLYEILIQKWIEREINPIETNIEREQRKQELYEFSNSFAIRIYQIWKNTGEFKMSKDDFNNYCKNQHFETKPYEFRSRSLINRDSSGNIKFAHKSFLEYYLAKHYFENPCFDINFETMDMGTIFYSGFCKKEFRKICSSGYFTIEESKFDGIFNNDMNYLTLTVSKKSNYNYKHLLFVFKDKQFSEVVFSWDAYSETLVDFFIDAQISSISINNYQKGVYSLKSLLQNSSLMYIAIQGTELPNSFIKEAKKMNIHVFHNNKTIVTSESRTLIPSLNMQMLTMEEAAQKRYNMDNVKDNIQLIANINNLNMED